jgi:nucleoside-diphosphate-sugar epimerase
MTRREPAALEVDAINPGFVLGPSLSPNSESGSLSVVDDLLSGRLFFGVPDLWFVRVDVREVAKAHIRAAKSPDSHGRYILPERRMTFSRILRKFHGDSRWLPKHTMPTFVVRLLGPLLGLEWKWIGLKIGVKFNIDNHRSIQELDIVYRPLEETLADHYRSWIAKRQK